MRGARPRLESRQPRSSRKKAGVLGAAAFHPKRHDRRATQVPSSFLASTPTPCLRLEWMEGRACQWTSSYLGTIVPMGYSDARISCFRSMMNRRRPRGRVPLLQRQQGGGRSPERSKRSPKRSRMLGVDEHRQEPGPIPVFVLLHEKQGGSRAVRSRSKQAKPSSQDACLQRGHFTRALIPLRARTFAPLRTASSWHPDLRCRLRAPHRWAW